MKKTLVTVLTIVLLLLTTAAIIDFSGKGGSSGSYCSGIFVTCESECKGSYLYSTADCGDIFYFSNCGCDGLLNQETRKIYFSDEQKMNLKSFVDHILELKIENSNELVSTLKVIEIAIESNNLADYSREIKEFEKIAERLNERELNLLNFWIEENHRKRPAGIN